MEASEARKTKNRRVIEMSHIPNLRAWLIAAKAIATTDQIVSKVALTKQTKGIRAFQNVYGRAGFNRWPSDVMRHSFVSYHIAAFNNRNLSAELAGHDVVIQKKHYENKFTSQLTADELKADGKFVVQAYAQAFFNILPMGD